MEGTVLAFLAVGLGIGAASGMLGIGGAVILVPLPGVVAVAVLWVAYGVRRALGERPKRPKLPPPDTEYFI